jgi:cell division protease FtsH
MVTRWGYSDELGTVAYGENQEEVFLGHSVSRQQNVSEQTAQKIDAEVKRLIAQAHDMAKKILNKKSKDLETLAQGLLEFETLSGEEIISLLKGIPPTRDDGSAPVKPVKPASSVPSTGAAKRRPGKGGGMEPEPQPQA